MISKLSNLEFIDSCTEIFPNDRMFYDWKRKCENNSNYGDGSIMT